MRSLAVLIVIGLAACGLDTVGGDAGPASAQDAGVDAQGSPADASGTTSDNDAAADTSVPGIVDSGVDVDAARLPPPASCNEIKQRDPLSTTGIKTITVQGRGELSVYCEMSVLNGGFTLIGRSGTNTGSNFGWTASTGTIGDLTRPYSLNATGIAFKEVFVAKWLNLNVPTDRGVVLNVPDNFLSAYANAQLDARAMTPNPLIVGPCTATNLGTAQQMVHRLGYTNRATIFYVRDVEAFGDFGLEPSGFDLSDNNCDRNMQIEGQGAIYVR